MSCVHPLKGFDIGYTANGKTKYLIRDLECDHIERVDGHWYTVHDKDEQFPLFNDKIIRDYTIIPCGKCVGCRLDYARRWSERLLMERQTSSSGLFVTLTYNDDSIPYSFVQNEEYGDIESVGYTLDLRDLQLFFKRLRKAFPESEIRMFSCGEYGSLNMRPHYHSIVFNLPVERLNLQFYKKVRGNAYYRSDVLERIWSVRRKGDDGHFIKDDDGKIKYFPLGYVIVGEFSVAAASYVARYCLKKATSEIGRDWYVDNGLRPEFVVMSRNPGIGYDYFVKHKETFMKYGSMDIGDEKGSHHISMNRFISSKLEEMYPDIFPEIKELRKEASQVRWEAELLGTDLDEIEYYGVKEFELRSKIKSLRRELE